MPRSDLWQARIPGQVFTIEQHAEIIEDGPGLVFSALIPELHHFNNRGGRTLPLLYPDGTPNLAPGLLQALSSSLGHEVTGPELLAYIAAVVSQPAYTATFRDELTTPGVRVPLTCDPGLFARGVDLGKQVIWLHTYGEAFTGETRPAGNVRYSRGDTRQPLVRTAITTMPEDVRYDEGRMVVILGDGEFGPVPPEVWHHTVGGKNTIASWLNYRKAEPGGKKTSPLDPIRFI